MATHTVQLKGWHAIVALFAIIGILVFRMISFSDMSDNESLMKSINMQLMSDYFPDHAARLKAAMQTKNKKKIAKVSKSLVNTKVEIDEVQVSYPLFSLSSGKDAIVKVVYTLDDGEDYSDQRTKYYLYRYSMLTNSWLYQRESTASRFYMNFI